MNSGDSKAAAAASKAEEVVARIPALCHSLPLRSPARRALSESDTEHGKVVHE